MIKTTLILILVLISSLLNTNGSTFIQRQEYLTDYLDKLRSTDPNEREDSARGIMQSKFVIQDRRGVINAIKQIAREYIADRERAGSAKTAISLLGDLQDVDSIPFFIENLTFHVFYKETKKAQEIGDAYPCAGALISIGMPSIDPIISKAEKTDDELILRISSWIVLCVLRDKASSFIQERVGQSNEEIQRRLLRMKYHIDLWKSRN